MICSHEPRKSVVAYRLERRMDAWFDSLPSEEQTAVKMKSWEKIFNVSPPYESVWGCCGKYVQATFWEMKLDQVVAIRNFKGRLHNTHSERVQPSK